MPKITEKYGKDAFEFNENSIVVRIPFNWINVMGDKAGNKRGNKPGNNEPMQINPNETQRNILKIIRDNPNVTKKQIQEMTGKGRTTVDNGIAFLKKNGFIVHIGSNKTGYWKVTED